MNIGGIENDEKNVQGWHEEHDAWNEGAHASGVPFLTRGMDGVVVVKMRVPADNRC